MAVLGMKRQTTELCATSGGGRGRRGIRKGRPDPSAGHFTTWHKPKILLYYLSF